MSKVRDVTIVVENAPTLHIKNIEKVDYNFYSTVFRATDGSELRINPNRIISVRFGPYREVV